MLSRMKLTAINLFAGSNVRVTIVLGTLVISALLGGAPSDLGDSSS